MTTPLHEKYPASRDLDALVAEKVMGWEPWHFTVDVPGAPVTYHWCPFPADASPDRMRRYMWNPGRGENATLAPCNHLPGYSTVATAAVEVMEEMGRKGYDTAVSLEGNGSGTWTASCGHDGMGWPYVEAPTMPHAVALASLLALGAIEEEPTS